MASNDNQTMEPFNRRGLKVAICAIAMELGFTNAEDSALETLTEMLQSFMTELTRSTKAYSELTGRTEPMVTDVVVALIEMGQKVNDLPAYARRGNALRVPAPVPATPNPEPKCLQVGVKRPHKSHINDYLPPYPDPHTYIKSLTQREPCLEYKTMREKAASFQRDADRNLTRFLAKTGYTDNLFSDDPYAFPLIANKHKPLAYMEAFMPNDLNQEGISQEDEDNKTNQQLLSGTSQDTQGIRAIKLERQESTMSHTGIPPSGTFKSELGSTQLLDNMDADSLIDNPYLRPIKMPKLTGTSKKYK